MKKTKIVSTLGPASTDVDTIVKLINAGANIFRFNFSHGDHPEHLGRIENVHKAEEITGKHVGIMLDTKGAEIRTTVQKEGKIEFNIGDKVRISMDDSWKGRRKRSPLPTPVYLTTFTKAATFSLMMACSTCWWTKRMKQTRNLSATS